MKKLIYLLVPVCLAIATACGDAPEPKEEPVVASEETARENTDKPEKVPAAEQETVKHDFSDVTPEMMVAFKRFREAMLNKDAVRLGSMIEGTLQDNCLGNEAMTAEVMVGLLDEAQLGVLKKRIETTVDTRTKTGGCVYEDLFDVADDNMSFTWSVGCFQVLEEEVGEYAAIFSFRKVNGKFRLVEVMCAG